MRPRQFDSDAVLDTVFEHFWCRGVRATSMSDLAKVTGMQRGSLYNAFGSKEKLFLAAYERYASAYLAAVDKGMDERDLKAQLDGYCRVSIANFCRGRPARSCPTTRGLMESVIDNSEGLGPEARKALGELIDQVIERVERAFTDGAARGEFTGDSRLSARQLVAVVRGLVILERSGIHRAELEAIAQHSVRTLLS